MPETLIAVRPDVGSSISVIFTPNWKSIVLGFSRDDRVYKCPCGKVEFEDIPSRTSAIYGALESTVYGAEYSDVVRAVADGEELDYRDSSRSNEKSPEYAKFLAAMAENCAMRELGLESGITSDQLQFFGQMTYTRAIRKKGKLLRQFTFLGVLDKQEELERDCDESREMADPEYWDVVDALRWKVIEDGNDNAKKVNPFHQIAIANCIIELRDKGVDKASPEFAELLLRIADAGFDIDKYPDTILGKIRSREI